MLLPVITRQRMVEINLSNGQASHRQVTNLIKLVNLLSIIRLPIMGTVRHLPPVISRRFLALHANQAPRAPMAVSLPPQLTIMSPLLRLLRIRCTTKNLSRLLAPNSTLQIQINNTSPCSTYNLSIQTTWVAPRRVRPHKAGILSTATIQLSNNHNSSKEATISMTCTVKSIGRQRRSMRITGSRANTTPITRRRVNGKPVQRRSRRREASF